MTRTYAADAAQEGHPWPRSEHLETPADDQESVGAAEERDAITREPWGGDNELRKSLMSERFGRPGRERVRRTGT